MKIAILSDIHANILALEACLKDLEARGVDSILSLGDLVGYGPEPEKVVKRFIGLNIPSVMGNHDFAVNAVGAERWFNPQAQTVVAITRRLLGPESLEFLKGLPLNMIQGDILFVHGFPPNSFKTYLYMVPEKGIKRVLKGLEQRIVFVGHTHELMAYELDGNHNLRVSSLKEGVIHLGQGSKYIINAGSVGQPRDGDPRAKYLILHEEDQALEILFVPYDVEKAAKGIIDRGFPEVYARRLFGRGR